jgi:thiamine-monophosphate kinase
MKLSEIGEFGFIDIIESHGLIRPSGIVKGIGDDCAVIEQPGGDCLLVTTDLLVEHVHFVPDTTTAEQLGEKALAVNLSDIAACGGAPLEAFISLAVPDGTEVTWLEGFYEGMRSLARQFDVNLLGGDTTKSKGHLVINIAVIGTVAEQEVLLRNGACVGDKLIITGALGESSAGLNVLLSKPDMPARITDPLVRSHLTPRPHVSEGRFLAQSGACTAAIDVSDGLSSDLHHICRQSGVGAIVRESALPVGPDIATVAADLNVDPLKWILNGGEDYVLLAAVQSHALSSLIRDADRHGFIIHEIGEIVSTGRTELLEKTGKTREITPQGWDHFSVTDQ